MTDYGTELLRRQLNGTRQNAKLLWFFGGVHQFPFVTSPAIAIELFAAGTGREVGCVQQMIIS